MKRFLFHIITISLLASCSVKKPVYLFTSFHEPATGGLRLLYSNDALRWTDLDTTFLQPLAGPDKIMRDPSITQGPDGTFHLVWTLAWTGNHGFGYASSKDLVHWSPQRVIPAMQHEPSAVNVWAPELFYDEAQRQFIIVWASTVPYRFPKGQEDEKNNHRLYYTTTRDFVHFTETRLFLDPGFSVIDATIVQRGRHDYVLVMKDNTRPNRNIKVAFSNNALGPYTPASAPFTPAFTEGPSVAKAGNKWFIYYDSYREKKYGAMQTADFKTFTDISGEISVPAGHKHGTIFMASKQTLRYIQQTVTANKQQTNTK
jgi:hypothetical protein